MNIRSSDTDYARTRNRPLPDGTRATLRLLGTTDLHAHLMAYDYYTDEPGQPYGLVRISTAIRRARAETSNTLLFDNGDALQGTPIGDLTQPSGDEWDGPSPVIDAMNALGYDAAGLGNHEFNFGIEWLARTLARAAHPITCANVDLPRDRGGTEWPVAPYLLLDRMLRCEDGSSHAARIGVLGLVPPQIATWDHLHLTGRLEAHDMLETAQRIIPQLRASGADLIVILAHSGIGAEAPEAMAENAALALAGIDGVDAIMTGHSHGLFPVKDTAPASGGIDHAKGALAGVPAMMAGACGGHLGVLDLTLTARDGAWRTTSHSAELRSVADLPCDAPLEARLAPAHEVTLRQLRRPVGTAPMRLHSYLALARSDPSVSALNMAQAHMVARALRRSDHRDLPVLSATPAFKTGGRGGPRHFTDLPAGTLSLRHAADLYPFPNRLCGLVATGDDLRDWLERAAICFATIRPGASDQMLRDLAVPGHDFDVISGVTYRLDLAAPPLYDRAGQRQPHAHGRIRDLRYQGRSVGAKDRFVLATNTYRAFGAGAFAPTPKERIVFVSERLMRDDLVAQMADAPLAPAPDHADNWRFEAMPGTSVLLDTGPALRSDPAAIASVGATDLGDTADGFCRLRLPL